MYVVTVEGQYFTSEKKLKSYSYTCNLPDMIKPLSVIKNDIEGRKMPKLYDDFVVVRTRSIADVKSELGLDAAPTTDNVHQMTADQLKDSIVEHKLPIDYTKYSDIILLRNDVAAALANLDSFLATKKDREEKAAEQKALDDLNPDLVDENEQVPANTLEVPSGNPLSGLE